MVEDSWTKIRKKVTECNSENPERSALQLESHFHCKILTVTHSILIRELSYCHSYLLTFATSHCDFYSSWLWHDLISFSPDPPAFHLCFPFIIITNSISFHVHFCSVFESQSSSSLVSFSLHSWESRNSLGILLLSSILRACHTPSY